MKKKNSFNFWNYWTRWILFSRTPFKKNYIVNGVKRRSSSINTTRVDHIYQDPHETNYKFRLHYGTLLIHLPFLVL